MARARRRKRASATDLYRTCKQAGTCPPDVINKVEGKTIADKILQYLGAGIFLGGLGIGTGASGGGGRLGYAPIGTRPGVTVGARPTIRPNIPLEAVGPEDLFPVDAVRPSDPAVVDMTPAPIPNDPSVGPGEVEVIAEIHPIPPRGPPNNPVTGDGSGSAVMEVAPEPSPPIRMRVRVSKSTHYNPAFHVMSGTSNGVGEASGSDGVVVLSGSGGHSVGESIELRSFHLSGREGAVEETSFQKTSTPVTPRALPKGRYPRPGYPPRRLYAYTETPLADIINPRRAVGVDVINPVYDPDLTVEFPETVAQAPNPDFTGVERLSRPLYGEGRGGRLRIGRLGRKLSMRTRSGTHIGPKDFFFRDISSILPEESIELGELSSHVLDEAMIVPPDSGHIFDSDAADFDSVSLGSISVFSDSELLDEVSYDFSGRLTFGSSRRSASVIHIPAQVPRINDTYGLIVDVGGGGADQGSPYPSPDTEPESPPLVYTGSNGGNTYYLHPSLRRRKRKRKKHVHHVHFSVPDGILAS